MIQVVVDDDEELVRTWFRLILEAAGDIEVVATPTGAAGFILKDTGPDQVAQVVRTLASGSLVLSPTVTRTVVDGYPGSGACSAATEQIGLLTERERAVLVLIAEGLSNTDIGTRVHVSVGTVKDHVSAILTKLRVGSRVQAALVAQRAGLLDGSREPV